MHGRGWQPLSKEGGKYMDSRRREPCSGVSMVVGTIRNKEKFMQCCILLCKLYYRCRSTKGWEPLRIGLEPGAKEWDMELFIAPLICTVFVPSEGDRGLYIPLTGMLIISFKG